MCHKSRHTKFQRSSAKGTFLYSGLNGRGVNNVRFSTENWPYVGNSERYGQGYYQALGLIESGIRPVR